MAPFTCGDCGKAFSNNGLLGNHRRFCKGPQAAPQKTPEPEAVAPVPKPVPIPVLPIDAKLESVCRIIRNSGLELEEACNSCRAPVRFYHDALRKHATGEELTDFEREAVAQVKQAEAQFVQDLMETIQEPDRNKSDAAKKALDSYNSRVKRRPLQFEYNALVLLDAVKRHASPDVYRAVLGDLCELDPLMATLALDPKLIGRG